MRLNEDGAKKLGYECSFYVDILFDWFSEQFKRKRMLSWSTRMSASPRLKLNLLAKA